MDGLGEVGPSVHPDYRWPMADYELVLVGGGNMGAALLTGLRDAATFSSLAVVEVSVSRRDELNDEFPTIDVLSGIPPCSAAVLATKPGDAQAVASAVAAAGARRLLSIAAGITTAALADAAGEGVAVVRAMPNMPALVGLGMSAITAGPGATDDDLAWAESILGAVGNVVRLPESSFDAFTGLVGSGPAYLFFVAEALVDAGVTAGLPRPVTVEAVTQFFRRGRCFARRTGRRRSSVCGRWSRRRGVRRPPESPRSSVMRCGERSSMRSPRPLLDRVSWDLESGVTVFAVALVSRRFPAYGVAH